VLLSLPQMSYATESPIFGFGNWMATSGLMLGVSSHSKAGINCPLPLPPPMLQMHVSSVSDVIRVMLQVFYMDVAKYIRMLHILPVFQRHVASVSEACYKRLFKIFHLFQTYVASVLIWMLHMFHTYVARVGSKCFSCFSLML
jgi:hypothetical protein